MKRVLVMLVAAAMAASCTGKKQAESTASDEKVLTKTVPAALRVIEQNEVYTSEIEPYKENDITPAVSGVHIDRILVDVGSRVKAGQLLVTLDPTQSNQQRLQYQTALDDYNRLVPVYEAGGISAQQLEQTKAALDVQKEVLDNLRKNIEMRSPIAGVVTARNYEAGNLFTGTPVLHVMQINPLKIIANIQEQYYPAVKLGMPVEIRTDIFPGEVFAGKVSLIYPALDASTRTFTVEVTVPNGNEKLRPGMFARSTFNMGDKEGIMVPDVAVLKQVGSSERYLYVVKDGKAERRSVKVGRQIGSDVDILSGVADGAFTTGRRRRSGGERVILARIEHENIRNSGSKTDFDHSDLRRRHRLRPIFAEQPRRRSISRYRDPADRRHYVLCGGQCGRYRDQYHPCVGGQPQHGGEPQEDDFEVVGQLLDDYARIRVRLRSDGGGQ